MTSTAEVPWSPFAPPPPPSNQSARVIDATDPPADSTPSGSSDSAESPTTSLPIEKSDSAANLEPIQGPSADENSVTDRNSALRTPHSENTTEKIGPQVSEGEGVRETPHSALNSAPKPSDSESRPAGEEATSGGTDKPADEGLADEDLTFKTASRAWLLGVGERVQPLARGLRPPVVWTESPASLRDLVAYATTAPWADKSGPIRMAGRIWCWTVAVPVSTVLYYACWLTQRPSRLIVLAVLWGLIAHTSFGSWLPWFWTTT